MSVNNYLDQDRVTKYAKLVARLKKWEEIKAKLREEILKEFAKGKKCPRSGPYLLELVKSERMQISWLDEWERLAKAHYGLKKWRAEKKLLEKDAPKLPIESLVPKINPDYRLDQPESLEKRRP